MDGKIRQATFVWNHIHWPDPATRRRAAITAAAHALGADDLHQLLDILGIR